MSQETATLGFCPRCRSAIGEYDVLIEFEYSDGSRGVYAECTDCDDVVSPDPDSG